MRARVITCAHQAGVDVITQAAMDRKLAAAIGVLRDRFWLLWLVTAALAVFSVTGITRLEFDDELIRFFNSNLKAFDDYVAVVSDFEGDSNDVIVLVEAEDLAAPAVLSAFSDFLLDAQFIPGVRAAISPLSLRVEAPGGGQEPLVPFPLPDRATMAKRFDTARAQSPAVARLLSADRGAMMAILPITKAGRDDQADRRAQLDALAALAARAEAASGAQVRLSGYPVLRDTVAQALVRDVIRLIAVGITVGFFIAVAALRSVRLGLATLPGPLMSVTVAMGLLGHLGVSINTVSITLPVLVLVLATSDSIHISFERARQAGRDTRRATFRAVRRVTVACLFAAATTAVAFAALATSRSEIIAEMGRMGAVVTLASVATVLLTQTLVLTAAGRFAWFTRLFDRLHRRPPRIFGFGHLPRLALSHPRPVAYTALVVLAATTGLYSQAGPRYSLMDSLRKDAEVLTVFHAVEDRLTPVSAMLVPVDSADPAVVARVHEAIVRLTGIEDVRSIASVVAEAGEDALAGMPEPLAGRLVSQDGRRALISVPFRYETGAETLALADRIDAGLAQDPMLSAIGIGAVTGLPVMSARVAGRVLDEINQSLLIALVAVALLILVWLRSLRVALISLVPNMLPVTLIGGGLMLLGRGIEFSNGLALTVAFGVAVDDTLHVLNRLRLSGGVSRIDRARLTAALDEVAPALVTTSMVLVLGTSGGIFAENKGVADFGRIAMGIYALALIADLLVLPAVLAVFGPRSYLSRRKDRP